MPVGISSTRSRFVHSVSTDELAQVAAEGRLRRIDERQEDLGADVARARPAALRRQPRGAAARGAS